MSGILDQLTAPQVARVTENQKSEKDLPFYYNAALKKDVQISRDFEAYMILSDSELKTSAINWINQAVGLNKPNKLRDSLGALALNQELKNSQLKIDAYAKTLGDFNKFRKNFTTDTVFAAIPEVQLFITDLQGMIDELIVGQQRAFFDNTIAQVVQRSRTTQDVSDAQLEELQSWTTVISAYLGG